MDIVYDIANLNDIPELVRLRILYMIDDFGSITDEERAGMEKQLPGYKKILELLRQDPTLKRAKMAGILGCSDATVKRALGSMVQKNVIRRIGSNKKGEWIWIYGKK